jgi:diacylglycerol kinase (ATP)
VALVRTADSATARSELSALARAGAERVIVIGGDGTMHLVGNLVIELGFGTRIALGLVPTGTGSDFARTLGLPGDPLRARDRALTAAPRSLDALQLVTSDDRRRFVFNVASAGISGPVDEAVNAMPGRGRAAYLRATLAAVWRYRPASCRVVVDGELWHDGGILLVAVANGETFGRGMRIAPGARPDDGVADVVLIRPVPRWQLPARLPQIYLGTHVHTRYVRTGRARQVRLEPRAPFPPFDLDGETFPPAPCDIVMVAGALRVVC